MKILIAVTTAQSYTLTRGQLQDLVKKGHEVVFACSHAEGIREKVENEGARYRPIEIEREIAFGKDFAAIRKAVKLLREERPDVVNASTPKAGLIFMLAALFLPSAYRIFTLRGLRSDTLSGVKGRIMAAMEQLTCRIAQRVIVIAPSLLEHAAARGIVHRSKAVVLGAGSSNGIDLGRFTPSEEIDQQAVALRKRLGIAQQDIVYGYLGRLVRDKGVEEVFQAFSNLQRQFHDCALVLTGAFEAGDPLPEKLVAEMRAHPKVFFSGHADDVRPILRLYDVLILFSYREGFGNVVLEAAAMERPAIVSDIPGARDTVASGTTGYLAQPRDPLDLKACMERYLAHPDERIRHGLAARKRAVASFSSQSVWDGLSALYEKLIKLRTDV